MLQTVREVTDTAPEITAPDYIQFYPTTRCNMACSFCFNRGMESAEDMAYDDFRNMVGVLKRTGVSTIDIMGGEPSLHREITRFLEFALREGMKLNMSSNGTAMEFLAGVRDHFPEVMVGVSVNDMMALGNMAETIRRKKMVVKTVASRRFNSALIDELLSCDPAMVYLLYRDAVDPAQLGETMPFDEFMRSVGNLHGHSRVGSVYCSGFLPDHERYPSLLNVRCPAGTTKLGILPDGSVYPCNLFFGFPEFRLGNILTTPFEEIWNHGVLTFFRSFVENQCPRGHCELHDRCHGGCPAHSYAHYGRLSAPEPRCAKE